MRLKLACVCACFAFCLSVRCSAQVNLPPVLPNHAPVAEDEQTAKIKKDMAKRANEERQAELERDTERLLKLATELKEQVSKSDENKLSLEVIKKAEEIERLAHNVREKMKGS